MLPTGCTRTDIAQKVRGTQPDTASASADAALDEFRKTQIPKLLTASTDEAFEEAYRTFVDHQKELGAAKLDEKINKQMLENFSVYGKTIEKVNKYTENP